MFEIDQMVRDAMRMNDCVSDAMRMNDCVSDVMRMSECVSSDLGAISYADRCCRSNDMISQGDRLRNLDLGMISRYDMRRNLDLGIVLHEDLCSMHNLDLGILPYDAGMLREDEMIKSYSKDLIDLSPENLISSETRVLIEIKENLREMRRKPRIINNGIIANELTVNNYTITNFFDALEQAVESEDIEEEEKKETVQKIKDLTKTLSSNSFTAGLFLEVMKILIGGR